MTALAHAPRLSLSDAEQLARDLYGMNTRASALPSERDQNFLLLSPDGRRYVLKVANAAETPQMLDAENQVMRRLERTGLVPSPWVPPVPTLTLDVVLVSTSCTNTSHVPLVSPGTRVLANDENTIRRPSALRPGSRLWPLP